MILLGCPIEWEMRVTFNEIEAKKKIRRILKFSSCNVPIEE